MYKIINYAGMVYIDFDSCRPIYFCTNKLPKRKDIKRRYKRLTPGMYYQEFKFIVKHFHRISREVRTLDVTGKGF